MKAYANNYDFSQDLPIAEKTEQQMADFLCSKLEGMTFLEHCNNSDYDLKFNVQGRYDTTVEVKEDFTCERTGNIGVEVSSWGRRSGIAVSKADYYLYKVHQPDTKIGVYIIETEKLKKMIKQKYWHREVVGGDPGSDSKNYLFKLNVVKDEFVFLGYVKE